MTPEEREARIRSHPIWPKYEAYYAEQDRRRRRRWRWILWAFNPARRTTRDARSTDRRPATPESTVHTMTTPTPPPAAYPPQPGPPGFYPPPRKRSFWGTPGGIILIVVGAIVALCAGCGGLATIGRMSDNNAVKQLDVSVTSCTATELTATIGYTVKNNGDQSKRVTLKVEYRDSSGARIDTDTAYVGSVPAGDTVRGEESTILNASPGGSITCKIVGVS